MKITRHQFDIANPFVLAKAKKMFRTRDFVGMEQCDLEQKLWCRVVKEAHRFDPSRGTWEAFVITVIESECASILRYIYAEGRDPGREAFSLDDGLPERRCSKAELDGAWRRVSYTPRPMPDLESDLSDALAEATEEQRSVGVALGLGSANSASAETDLSRRNVARTVEELGQLFEDAGLRVYL